MIYIDEKSFNKISFSWKSMVGVIEKAIYTKSLGNFSQPIKPYVRFSEKANRIIAMPAYLGKPFHVAGMKWIASFPKNIFHGLPRAHSVVILNNANTGKPEALFTTSVLSAIRTAAVSAVVLKKFLEARKPKKISVGIIGFGPIGQHHLAMCQEILGKRLSHVKMFDIRKILTAQLPKNVTIVKSWEDVYQNSDMVFTCTVAKKPYINKPPKKGALLLNVSLRDYGSALYPAVKKSIIVDDWEEVCRENTDIEVMAKQCGLKEKDVSTLEQVVLQNSLRKISKTSPIMFNPMGLAIFDLAIASYFFKKAKYNKLGVSI